MSKRERSEDRYVFVSGFSSNANSHSIARAFATCGKIERIHFRNRKNCIVWFEESESVWKALKFHGTKQPSLNANILKVSVSQEFQPAKKPKPCSGSFIVLDPPRFNNFMIPILPSFM
ncbi:unnamed protein product [Blepharisma stoltei]|uniref:RRM domain-containing protein n=1 Tax=Blepharisma stoltei TaxID=1481888 RepID=A0AAU9KCN3_9CILI|nr:unnamed protein product [Blepharisma stoltei]